MAASNLLYRYVSQVMTNCDELFEREELSAAPDIGWPDCFNSGVFVFTPCDDTFRALVQLASETGSFDGELLMVMLVRREFKDEDRFVGCGLDSGISVKAKTKRNEESRMLLQTCDISLLVHH